MSEKTSGISFTSTEYLMLIAGTPVLQFMEFIFLKGWDPNVRPEKNFTPYLYIVCFLFIVFKSRYEIKQIALLILFATCVIFYPSKSLANNASYLINVFVSCSLLLYLRDNPYIILTRPHYRQITLLAVVVVGMFYLFSTEVLLEGRFYLSGFVIPHQFAYYCASFAFLFLYSNRLLSAICVSLAGIYVGARSGLLATLIPYCYYVMRNLQDSKLKLLRYSFVALILGLMVAVTVDASLFERLESTVDNTFNFQNKSTDEYSESRTIIWFNMFQEIEADGLSWSNIIGRGPYASINFNYSRTGLEIWMHNDIFDLLFNLGVLGVMLYIYCFFKYLQRSDIYSILFFLIMIVTNGFFTYSPVTMILLHYLAISHRYKRMKII